MKLKHILVATDLSPHARDAYVHAAALAQRFAASLTLLHVTEALELTFLPTATLVAHAERAAEQARERLEEEGAWFAQRGLPVTLRAAAGTPAEEIIRLVENEAVDLCVLTRHGRARSQHFFVGATARRVLRHIRIPLLLVPPTSAEPGEAPFTGYHRLLAATDYGDDSRRGLAVAVELAKLFAARVTLTHVVRLPGELDGTLDGRSAALPAQTLEWLEQHHREQLTALADETDPTRVDVRVVVEQSPAAGLAAAAKAEKADLIVVPSHGKGAFRAILLGSTSERLLGLSPVPVLVLPRGWLEP